MIEYLRRSRARLDTHARPPHGAGSVVVQCGERAGLAEIEVEFFHPPDVNRAAPFLFLLHGRERDAARYRDAWIPLARRMRRILLAPRFDAESFPGSLAFNQGNVVDARGVLQPPERWTFGRVEQVFDALSAWFGHHVPCYDIYGHSAGAQFLHRLLLLLPEARARLVIAANAGWYTLPDFRARYPYGLQGTPASAESLRAAFGKKLVVLLGAEDTDHQDPSLRRLPREHEQGSNRLERGTKFFHRSAEAARKLGGGFDWRMLKVQGVDHDHVAMIPTVAALLGTDVGDSSSGSALDTRVFRPNGVARPKTPWWRSFRISWS